MKIYSTILRLSQLPWMYNIFTKTKTRQSCATLAMELKWLGTITNEDHFFTIFKHLIRGKYVCIFIAYILCHVRWTVWYAWFKINLLSFVLQRNLLYCLKIKGYLYIIVSLLFFVMFIKRSLHQMNWIIIVLCTQKRRSRLILFRVGLTY